MENVFEIFLLVLTSFLASCSVVSVVLFIVKKTIGRRAKIPEIEPIFDEKGFIDFCYGILSREERVQRAATEVESLNKRIASISKDLRNVQTKHSNKNAEEEALEFRNKCKDLSEQLKAAQLELSKGKARLNRLREHKKDARPDSYTYEQAKNDFQQIKSMRGVCQIFINETVSHYTHCTQKTLEICVRVTYAHGRYLYDLGDYMIMFQMSNLEWEVSRIRFEGHGGYGNRRFCFGDRVLDISDYVDQGRIVEAVEIIIESLHHINEGRDQKNIPEDYKIVRRLSRKEREELRHS